jgi:hypothetical protein
MPEATPKSPYFFMGISTIPKLRVVYGMGAHVWPYFLEKVPEISP